MRATPSSTGAPNARQARGSGDYVPVGPQEWLDDEWNYRMHVPRGYQAHPGQPLTTLGSALYRLARYEKKDMRAEIEVLASRLVREVDAGDWLACSSVLGAKGFLEGTELEGSQGEATVEGAWEEKRVPWRGRFSCVKSGPRMFLLACSAPKTAWDAVSGDMEVAIESFEPVLPPPYKYAEPLRSYGADTPVAWTISLPESWVLEPGSSGEHGSSFQAENMARERDDADEMIGKLAFAVLARSVGETPRAVANIYLDAVREHGLDVGDDLVEQQPAKNPFLYAWQLSAPVWREGMPGEVRCRVMCHERVWALGGVLTLRREENATAWMQNKRALDLVTSSLRLLP